MGSPRTLSKKQVLDAINREDGMIECDLRGLDLSGVAFDGVDMRRAKLAECNLSRASFRGTDLTLASLWHCECQDAVFDGANLEEADLDFCNLDGCSFKGAKIRKAIFPFTRLPLTKIAESVRTGKRVRMASGSFDD